MNYQIKRANSSINSSDSLQSNTSMFSFLPAAHAAAEAQFKHTSTARWKVELQAHILYLLTTPQTNFFFNFLILFLLCFNRGTSCNESVQVSLQLEQH